MTAIIVPGADTATAGQNLHSLPDQWLGARVRGWMFDEAKGSNWWVCGILADGRFKYASHPENAPMHADWRDHARRICRHVNRHAAEGGTWLAGYIGQMFYLLWKDRDGDIQIPIEFGAAGVPMPLPRFLAYSMDDFAQQCLSAIEVWREHQYRLDMSRDQQIKLAQGQRISSDHADEAAKYVVMPDALQ